MPEIQYLIVVAQKAELDVVARMFHTCNDIFVRLKAEEQANNPTT